jgi:MurNAc alpha-1-phosphate uridylyltransferase
MKTAMIFSAGRGERLRPLTDTCPKPLCKIQGIPLIDYHMKHLAAAGFQKIVVNLAHLGGEIRAHLGNGARFGVNVIYSPEPPGALETGGGIINALGLLDDDAFVTVNADIYTDYSFQNLHCPPQRLAHLVLVPKPDDFARADFGLSAEGQLSNENRLYTFTGIACYRSAFFADLKPGRFSITPHLRQQADKNCVSAEIYRGGRWIDIGSPARLQAAQTFMNDAFKT